MKEAKSEAEQIISAYRAEMEAAYQSKLNQVTIPIIPIILIIHVKWHGSGNNVLFHPIDTDRGGGAKVSL